MSQLINTNLTINGLCQAIHANTTRHGVLENITRRTEFYLDVSGFPLVSDRVINASSGLGAADVVAAKSNTTVLLSRGGICK